MSVDVCVRNIDRLCTCEDGFGEGPLGALDGAAVAWRDGRVVYVGDSSGAPRAHHEVDAEGCLGMPGLVDCHTHVVWAGSRATEFRRRLSGVSYTQILEEGGGILSTVAATRSASEAELVDLAARRMARSMDRGVVWMEAKSGYGLTPDDEVKCLRAARAAGSRTGMGVRTTFLGAHAIPMDHRSDRSSYVRQVIEEQLPRAAPWSDAVDVYIDRGAFTLEEGREILMAGARLGLAVRVHAEQVEHTGAAAMAAEIGALSADHLERIDERGILAMARAGTTAVLLPTAMLYLHDQPPPIRRMREAGVRFAVATDLNPGSSPSGDLWLAATLACLTMGLTVEEAILGVTREAARAMGIPSHGRLYLGGPADLALFRPPTGEPAAEGVVVQRLEGHEATWLFREGRQLRGPAA